MTEEQLREIEQRAAAATDGPWDAWNLGAPDGEEAVGYYRHLGDSPAIHAHNRAYCQRHCVEQDGRLDHRYAQGLLRMDGDPVDTRGQCINDADFIAHARDDVPALIAALRAAWAEQARLREGYHLILGLVEEQRQGGVRASMPLVERIARRVLLVHALGEDVLEEPLTPESD